MAILAGLVLFGLMIVVGLELTPADFRRVARYPRVVVVGTLGQLTVLPALVALALSHAELSPTLVGGVLLITSTPGGALTNLLCHVAGANAALSVTLTAVASLLSVVTLPVLLSLGFERFLGDSTEIALPVLPTVGQLAALLLLPIGLGMWARARRPDRVARVAPLLRRLALVGLAVLITAATLSQADQMSAFAAELRVGFCVAAAWLVLAVAAALVTAWLAGARGVDRFTLAIEFSVKNAGLAAVVAIATLGRTELALFAAPYILVSNPLALAASLLHRRLLRPAPCAPGV